MSAGRVGSRFWDVSDSTGRSCRYIVTRPILDRSDYSGVVTRPIFVSVGLQCVKGGVRMMEIRWMNSDVNGPSGVDERRRRR